MGIGPDDLLNDLKTFDFLFEALCVRDLRVFADMLGGDKLFEEGAESLKAMQSKIDTDKMKSTSFLMVLTETGDYAYCRQDGAYVVPIGCLKN